MLVAAGLKGPMGRVASAPDNAAMESFWALLQKNALDQRKLAHPRAASLRDRVLDRAHLQPLTPSTRSRQTHPVAFELAFAPNDQVHAA